MSVFEVLESEVRSYCRAWPVVFDRAYGSYLYALDGTPYLDFFAGAGSLNYGHNNPVLKQALIDYLMRDGVMHALDMYTSAKCSLLETLEDKILKPRGLGYKVMLPGPGGTNAVEAALKLARKVTGRPTVAYFTNAFHGMTLGSLSVAGMPSVRASARIPLTGTAELPYDDGGLSFSDLETLIDRDRPAAVIVETVQGEGGVNTASHQWLRELQRLCETHGVLIIVDDVQMGCGRTGPFFSFEQAGIEPDIVCLSKALSGIGLPLSLTLLKPGLDVWRPGEHNGTFRGVNAAFVTGTHALKTYWGDSELERATVARGELVDIGLRAAAAAYPAEGLTVTGRGLVRGLRFGRAGLAQKMCAEAFNRRLLLETCGPNQGVVKLIPPLTVTDAELDEGLDIIGASLRAVLEESDRSAV